MRANTTKKLYPFQGEGVRFLTLHPNHPDFPKTSDHFPWQGIAVGQFHKFLADDMGLGKTIQVIGAMNAIDAQYVIILCPANVKIHWARMLIEWSRKSHSIFIVRKGSDVIPPETTAIIINYDLLLNDKLFKQLVARGQARRFNALVIDEAHYLKGLETKRTRRVLGKGSFIYYADFKWLLSGTPIPNRPAEFYPILYSLAQNCIKPYVSWRAYGEYFCNGHRDRKCRKCGASLHYENVKCPRCASQSSSEMGYNTQGASHTDELSRRIDGFMFRRELGEVVKELPDVVETIIELDIQKPAGVETEPLATARRLLAEAKTPESIRFIVELLSETSKVVVFAYHRGVIASLLEGLLAFSPVLVQGGMSTEQKQVSVDRFVTDPNVRAIVAQISAGGTATDGLQIAANYMVFVERDWSPGTMAQAIARLRRIGQKNTVFVYHLCVADSLDTQMDEAVEYKKQVISQIVKSKEVNHMSSIDPNVQVALANAMTSIAAAMHAIASALGVDSETSSAPVPAASRGNGAKGAKKDPVPDPPVGAATAQAAVVNTITEEDFRKAVGAFLATPGTDRNVNKAIVNEQIWPKYGATALADLKPSFYAAAMEDLKKGPAAYGSATEDLSGI